MFYAIAEGLVAGNIWATMAIGSEKVDGTIILSQTRFIPWATLSTPRISATKGVDQCNRKIPGCTAFHWVYVHRRIGVFGYSLVPEIGSEKVDGTIILSQTRFIPWATLSTPRISATKGNATGKYLGAQLFTGFTYIAASVFLAILWFLRRKGHWKFLLHWSTPGQLALRKSMAQ
jgi:hypothetical protein